MAAIVADTGVSEDEAKQIVSAWEVTPFVVNGEVAGAAMMRGSEIHVALSEEWKGRALTRSRIREFLRQLAEPHGFLTTRVESHRDDSFVRRIGFKPTWSDGQFNFYMLAGDALEKKDRSCR